MPRPLALPLLFGCAVALALLAQPASPAQALTLKACQSRVVPFEVAAQQATRVLRDMAQQMERLTAMWSKAPANDRQAFRQAHADRITLVEGRIAGLEEELDCWYGQLAENPPPPDDGGVIDPQLEELCKRLTQAVLLMQALLSVDPDAAFQTSSLFPPPETAKRCPELPPEEES